MIFIGIDGGGTKTAITAVENGKSVSSAVVGPMNYNFRSFRECADDVISGIKAMGIPAGSVAAIGIGDPSISDDTRDADDNMFCACLRESLASPVYARSDAYMTLYGMKNAGCPGTLVISGTGAMAVAENSAGEIKTAGGWGRLTGDEGGGYYIALKGIKSALRAFDGIAEDTSLLESVTRYYDVKDTRDLIGVFYGEKEPDIAGFAVEVARQADLGDKTACEIICSAAWYLASYAIKLAEWSHSGFIGVYGGVITGNAMLRSEFERLIHEKLPYISITEPSVKPEHAAAVFAENKYYSMKGETI